MISKNDLAFIKHILDSADAIESFSEGMNKVELISNRMKRSAIIREIEIIGEAVKNLSVNLKNEHDEVQWKNIIGTRNKMTHHYFGVDIDMVWKIVKEDLPILKKQMEKIKKELAGE